MRLFRFVPTLLVLVALAACGRDESAVPTPGAPPPAAEPDGTEKIAIRNATNELEAFFRLDVGESPEVQVVLGDGEARRVLKTKASGRQHRYVEAGAGPVALARTHEGTFNVRGPGGDEILWRVRLGKNRILFSGNTRLPDFEIRQVKPNRFRVLVAGDFAGTVDFQAKQARTLVKGPTGDLLFKVRGERKSAAFGVLAVPGLEPVEKAVLVSELFLAER